MRRSTHIVFSLIPILCAVTLYWYAFQTWFQNDDFAWLGLGLELRQPRDLVRILFSPMAQGTIRPLSERLYFLAFAKLSWLDPRPFHAWCFLTVCAVIGLLQWLAFHLTRSRLAGVAAPVFWLCGIGAANAIPWISSYNQILFSFFLTAGLCCLIRASETGRRRWHLMHWACFLLGFGALENQVVYPVLALLCARFFAPRLQRAVLWMFPVSILYAAVHSSLVPAATGGPYVLYWDLSLFRTLLRYLGMAFGGWVDQSGPIFSASATRWIAAGLGLALAVYALYQAVRHRRLAALFGLAWLLVVLAPVLPLRDHVSEYYLASATLGLSLAGGDALATAYRAAWKYRFLAAVLFTFHLSAVLSIHRPVTFWYYQRGERVRRLVAGLERAAALHPGKTLLLANLDAELFAACLCHTPARLFSDAPVYLAPGQEHFVTQFRSCGDSSEFVADSALAARAIAFRQAAVYRWEEPRLVNITRQYRRRISSSWLAEKPRVIALAHPAFGRDLGEGWHPPENGWRWMGKRAVVHLAPPQPGDKLFISAYLPRSLAGRATRLTIWLNGVMVGQRAIGMDEEPVEAEFSIPDHLCGQPGQITLDVDRAVKLPDSNQAYGLVVVRIGWRR